MRILCLNANTSPHITAMVGAAMRETLGPDAGVDVIEDQPVFGPAVIKTRLDNAIATHGIVDAAARRAGQVDAVMLAVSFDTGRDALREALDIPVVGMTEASVAMARMCGSRIGYVSIGLGSDRLYLETLTHCALDRDMAGWREIEAPAAYDPGDRAGIDALVADSVNDLARTSADAVVVLGAVMSGTGRRIQDRCPVPVIDGAAAGALMAHAMARLAPPKATIGAFAQRSEGRFTDVSDALSQLVNDR